MPFLCASPDPDPEFSVDLIIDPDASAKRQRSALLGASGVREPRHRLGPDSTVGGETLPVIQNPAASISVSNWLPFAGFGSKASPERKV